MAQLNPNAKHALNFKDTVIECKCGKIFNGGINPDAFNDAMQHIRDFEQSDIEGNFPSILNGEK